MFKYLIIFLNFLIIIKSVCDYSCDTCTNITKNGCLTCFTDLFNNRAIAPVSGRCDCKAGWYDDTLNLFC